MGKPVSPEQIANEFAGGSVECVRAIRAMLAEIKPLVQVKVKGSIVEVTVTIEDRSCFVKVPIDGATSVWIGAR